MRLRKLVVALLAGILLAGSLPPPAEAQGLLGALFGLLGGRPERVRPPAPGPDIPGDLPETENPGREMPAGRVGQGVAYCVRTCDGRYFPLHASGETSPEALCQAMCPATETRIYWGGGANQGPSIAGDGSRYQALPAAFAYRARLTPNCTCNGRTAAGLAPLAAQDDPTLRAGDVVVTKQGINVVTGSADTGQPGNFTPLAQAPGLSPDMRRQLARIAVAPAGE